MDSQDEVYPMELSPIKHSEYDPANVHGWNTLHHGKEALQDLSFYTQAHAHTTQASWSVQGNFLVSYRVKCPFVIHPGTGSCPL